MSTHQPPHRVLSMQLLESTYRVHERIRGPLQALDPTSTLEEPGGFFEHRFPSLRQERSGRFQRSNLIQERELKPAGPGLPPQFSILIAMRFKLRRGPVPRHLSSSRGLPPKLESPEDAYHDPATDPRPRTCLLVLPAGQPRLTCRHTCEGVIDFEIGRAHV